MEVNTEVKTIISSILGLPAELSKYWDILDSYPKDNPELYLIHYNDNFDITNRVSEKLWNIRGVIVDINKKVVVANSHGYVESLPCNNEIVEDKDNIIIYTHIKKYFHKEEDAPYEDAKITFGDRKFNKNNTFLYIGYEGAFVRIFKWKGKVFFSTHKKIDATTSHWKGRTAFYTLYKMLNGPMDELFGDEDYSPYCHLFLITHNDIRLCTSVRDNRILYLGVNKMWEDTYGTNYKLVIPKFVEQEDAFQTFDHGLIKQPPVSVDIANKFLFPTKYAEKMPEDYNAIYGEMVVYYDKQGNVTNIHYYGDKTDDERLNGGDFIILYTKLENGDIKSYKLESPGYAFRKSIVVEDPNLYHRFVIGMSDFFARRVDMNELPKLYDQNGQLLTDTNGITRRYYWWALFYNVVNPTAKDEAFTYYNKYNADLHAVCNFILYKYDKLTHEQLSTIKEKVINRFNYIKNATKNGFNVKASILNLLSKEYGVSFYKMLKVVEKFK